MTTNKKLTVQDFKDLCNQRGDTFVSVSDINTPGLGLLTFICKSCGTQVTVAAQQYTHIDFFGCTVCRSIEGKKLELNKANEFKKMHPHLDKRKRQKRGPDQTKIHKWSHIQNRIDLLQELETNKNAYNTTILELLNNPPQNLEDKLHKHHIIPLHDGGPNESWNICWVSAETHAELHSIRFEVYKQAFDKFASLTTKLLAQEDGEAISLMNQANYAYQKAHGIGICALGASQKGGHMGGSTPSPLRTEHYKSIRSDKISRILEKESVWYDENSNEHVTLPPCPHLDCSQYCELLVESLPDTPIKSRLTNLLNDRTKTAGKETTPRTNALACFRKVLSGARKKYFGLSCLSAEAED